MQTLSLCMIVKDEEKWIGQCLESIHHVVDEMIIVDTGSTDQTVEICQSYGATVLPYTWNENFADARNYGLKHAKSDWILWLDADEEVDQKDISKLRESLDTEEHILLIQLVNYFGNFPPDPDQAFLLAHHRLFRNHMGFRFENAIHEKLNVTEVLGGISEVTILPIRVHHYGYTDPFVENKNKLERNLRMLEKEKQKEGYSPWVDYHIASEYYRAEKYTESFEYVNESIRGFVRDKQVPPSLIYKLKYAVLLLIGSHEGAWPGIEKVIQIYPDYVDLHFYKGVILFLREEYEEAIQVFNHCLELGEEHTLHLVLKGAGSFHPNYYIGRCQEKRGNVKEAIAAYRMAIEQSNHYEPAIQELQRLLSQEKVGLDQSVSVASSHMEGSVSD
ncbi:glycosyltransferase involved in cell wall biosynthesis [Croceifilum oryzae]|uniref:Glycosyltransferase involved in cell wall biosynthesis n=1 Tax=Croceifilum oryzae TaxID=1553429 RepID=A0AAJ1TJD2_9BACL|nr:glycosyltransferase [Croceifilum oryzae]MDQ0417079.1 glycosyltransferase involved in cell wall biosynthesis [Croceifilum oryzae]